MLTAAMSDLRDRFQANEGTPQPMKITGCEVLTLPDHGDSMMLVAIDTVDGVTHRREAADAHPFSEPPVEAQVSEAPNSPWSSRVSVADILWHRDCQPRA